MAREITAPTPAILSAKSFDGKHTIQFNEKSHRYKLNGEACPGVTTVIKSSYPTPMGLLQWMKGQSIAYTFDWFIRRGNVLDITEDEKKALFKDAKAADKKVAQEAADIGTVLHALAELSSRGKTEEVNTLLNEVKSVEKWPEIKACYDKFLDWSSKNTGLFLSSEELIASPKYLFCGKYDLLSKRNGKTVLSDYKTSSGIYAEQKIQLAAYRLALKSWSDITVDAIEILRFGKADGAFESWFTEDLEEIMKWEKQAIRCRETYELIRTEER